MTRTRKPHKVEVQGGMVHTGGPWTVTVDGTTVAVDVDRDGVLAAINEFRANAEGKGRGATIWPGYWLRELNA